MTLDELKQSQPFLEATPQEQAWVLHYIEHRSIDGATEHAYPAVNPENRRGYGRRVKGKSSVQSMLRAFDDGEDFTQDDLEKVLVTIIRDNSGSVSNRLGAANLWSDIKGIRKGASRSPATPEFDASQFED